MNCWTMARFHSMLYLLWSLQLAYTDISPNLTRRETIAELFKGYDPTALPNDDLDIPTLVAVQIFISSIDSFDEAAMLTPAFSSYVSKVHVEDKERHGQRSGSACLGKMSVSRRDAALQSFQCHPGYIGTKAHTEMDYSMTIFLRQRWHDPRLCYENNTMLREPLELDSRIIDNIWLPDLFFVNEKNARFHTVTVANRLLHIYRNGTIFYSLRLSLKLSCQMDLQKYPLDTQSCPILVESYGHSTEYIEFTWFENEAVITEDVVVSQFKLTGSSHTSCRKNYGIKNYTCLRCDLRMERDTGYYIIQIYIPSVLIVILSWVSFWLNVEAIPARISLGVLTILTLTTQSSSLQASLPRVSYAKALDVWMAFCLCFVFAALLEFAFVNVLSRRCKNVSSENLAMSKDVGNFKTYGQKQALLLDRVSRFFFPILFGLINIVYWVYYLLA